MCNFFKHVEKKPTEVAKKDELKKKEVRNERKKHLIIIAQFLTFEKENISSVQKVYALFNNKLDFRKRQKRRRRRKRLTFQSCQRSIGEDTILKFILQELKPKYFPPLQERGNRHWH